MEVTRNEENHSTDNVFASNPYAATTQDLNVNTINGEQELADRTTRLVAVLIDGGLIAVIGIGTAILLPLFAKNSGAGLAVFGAMLGLVGLAIFIVQLVFIARYAQSIGKRAMKIRVMRVSTDEPCGLGRYFWLRIVAPAVIGAIPIVGGVFSLVDPLMIFRDDKRCAHDLMADTKVIKV